MFDELERALPDEGWAELRYHDRQSRGVLASDGRIESASTKRHTGVGVRVLLDGAWGFASTSELTLPALQRAVGAAQEAARAAAKARADRVPDIVPAAFKNGRYAVDARSPLSDTPFEEKIALVRQAEARCQEASGRIQSASSSYRELLDEKFIVTSDGARVHLLDQKPEFRVSAVAAMEGELMTHTEAEGHTGGMGDLFARRSWEEMVDAAAKTATDLLRAGYIEGGRKKVILAPDVVGLLVHEAIGHTVEADFVLAGSAAQGKMGTQVASDLVTLRDSGFSEYEAGAGGVVLVDDEGVPAQNTTIIENGVLKSYLHNRETAAKFGVEPTGNARAFEYDNEPLIRMRNTFIEPGDSKLDEMIASTDDGYLLAGAKNGQADSNAEFMFAVSRVYPIKNGKLGELHRSTTITGDAFDVLKSVDQVGDDFAWDLGSGFCGKGQPAKVDAGGPHLRCSVTLAGKDAA